MESNDTAILVDALRVYRGRLGEELREMHSRNPLANFCIVLRRTLDTVDRLISELS